MTQTPTYVFRKNTFAWAVDMARDFKKQLFDCVAGLATETAQDKAAFAELEQMISNEKQQKVKKLTGEKDSAYLYLANTVIFCRNNPDSPQTKAFVELWKSLCLLFPTTKRPVETFVDAFKSVGVVKDLFESTKAQYYILHAFANHNHFSRQADFARALTVVANNEHATVVDLFAVLEERSDIDEKIATAIVEKCCQKIEKLQKIPVAFRDNRMSGNKVYDTRYSYQMKSICLDGKRATRILLGLSSKYAIEKQKFFNDTLEKLTKEMAEHAEKAKMPDINDLSQFPHYATLLKQAKEAKTQKK